MAKLPPPPAAFLAAPQAPRLVSSQPSTNATPPSRTTPGPTGGGAVPGVAMIPAPPAFPMAPPAAPKAAPGATPPHPPQAPAGMSKPAPPALFPPVASFPPSAAPPKKLSASGSQPDTPPLKAATKKAQQSQTPTSITIEQVAAPGLLDYGMHLLTRSGIVPPTFDEQKRRGRAFFCYNACVSPVHVVAGWAVAGLSADTKTRDFVEAMIEKKALDLSVSRKGKTAAESPLHSTINLIIGELGVPSFIRLYIEPQFAIPQVAAIVNEINNTYGDADAPVIKPLCFSCDDSGDATARKINHDITTFTQKRVTAVIDSNSNLHRLAQACLVSVFATTFAWSVQDPAAQPGLAHFYGGNEKRKKGMSKVRCLTDTGAYRFTRTDHYDCIELAGLSQGETCCLIRPKSQSIVEWVGSTSGAVLDDIVAGLPKAKQITVSVPLFTVETPMRLGEAASAARGRYSLWRLFDREKCKLTRIFYKSGDDSLCTLPLWDHYHQTVFELSNKPDADKPASGQEETPKTDIERLDDIAKLNKQQLQERVPAGADKAPKLIYHKLDDCTHGVWAEEARPAPPQHNGETCDMPGKLSFDTPFLFYVRKQTGKKSQHLPVCVGIFTNADSDEQHDALVD